MESDNKEITKLSEASKLTFNDQEIEVLLAYFDRMKKTFEKLDSVDISGVEPIENILSKRTDLNSLREDEIGQSLLRNEILKNALGANESAFIVPRVID